MPLKSLYLLTELGEFLQELYHLIFEDLHKEKKYGCYIEDYHINPEFIKYLYKPLDVFSPKTIITFKCTKEWLRDRIIYHSKGRFNLEPSTVPQSFTISQLNREDSEESKYDWIPFLRDNEEFYLDTEIYSFEGKNPMNNLGLRTLQLGNSEGKLLYLIWEDMSLTEREELINYLVGKRIYVFNLNFDTSQLAHAGFKVIENTWLDVALLARITYNDKVDKGQMSLGSLVLNLVFI